MVSGHQAVQSPGRQAGHAVLLVVSPRTNRWSVEPGLGDEALTSYAAGTSNGGLMTVVFRVRNVEVEVDHHRHNGKTGPGLVDRALVLEVAHTIATRLPAP